MPVAMWFVGKRAPSSMVEPLQLRDMADIVRYCPTQIPVSGYLDEQTFI